MDEIKDTSTASGDDDEVQVELEAEPPPPEPDPGEANEMIDQGTQQEDTTGVRRSSRSNKGKIDLYKPAAWCATVEGEIMCHQAVRREPTKTDSTLRIAAYK